ncbi:MAG TPA: DUF255 domain-containing protein [Planctomycetota bacterium]|nr:DUF255 domain-containing protein [Planctomycetota bacterium]
MKLALAVALVAFTVPSCASTPPAPPPSAPRAVAWEEWRSPEIFAKAQAGKKLVLLDLGTGWCHWCHVMEETTYKDATVVALLDEHFVAARADADARPDLANRYEDYGWPATIIFDAKGTELVKLQGYKDAARMISLLRAVVDDPTPGPSARFKTSVAPAASSSLSAELKTQLRSRFMAGYDEKHAGWGESHKFVDLDAIELSVRDAVRGDTEAWHRARRTLDAERNSLIDRVWGGAYQYSDSGVWENPHFEKIMSRQAADIIAFSLAHEVDGVDSPEFLAAARAVDRFLSEWLTSPEGTFYASMDADLKKGEHGGEYFALDDAKRRARGIPEIDRHVYARENGWAIEALTFLHAASGDDAVLARATKAAERIVATHSVGGGFKHEPGDEALYLGDTLAMGRAFLRLAFTTGDRRWLDRASSAARFIDANFATDGGYLAAKARPGDPTAPLPELDENVSLARFANLLHHATGDPAFRAIAERAMRFVASPDATRRRGFYVAGVLLADEEMGRAPLSIEATRPLVPAALRLPLTYLVIKHEEGEKPSALVCGAERCHAPVESADDLRRVALELEK